MTFELQASYDQYLLETYPTCYINTSDLRLPLNVNQCHIAFNKIHLINIASLDQLQVI